MKSYLIFFLDKTETEQSELFREIRESPKVPSFYSACAPVEIAVERNELLLSQVLRNLNLKG